MTTYQETLDHIHSLLRFGSRPGLERIRTLLKRLGNPQEKLKFVHVAGTNGKGSTTCMIAAALQRAGYRTGLYISPYVVEFRERMQINGAMITEEELCALMDRVRPQIEEMAARDEIITEFEAITAAAFLWYYERGCDIVCLEVGLGGRFDATNVIGVPEASVICSISLDHTDVLGDTLAQIAMEKCGIIKPGGVTVCYPLQEPEALAVIMEHAAKRGNPLIMGNFAGADIGEETMLGSRFRYRGLALRLRMAGRHQIANAVTAVETLLALRERGYAVPDAAIVEGLASVRFPARMEVLCERPLIVLDGAHNLSGMQALEKVMASLDHKDIRVIMGMLSDKDYRASVALIAPYCRRLATIRPENGRALDPAVLAELARVYVPETAAFEDYDAAIAYAMEGMGEEDVLFICGSLYLATSMREKMTALLQKR
ncbi:bifunctional folylpolyglutamate synthase/dihydrofolate synthase [Zongyangia hominis]|uniref:tetrahydrofolate synthase n=1 Tax=Zongyangia hominis TaxID=2763677 RepID=A0A926E968_9FIRM|nr:folylpolyglutamate synthase/dihydrofolate synthase family protein [Zongyangia hominis]MBC8570215.1 bifunctional folylpolyglutamate synthase/dihydrofolate synthase [Zongyangia hominis]